MPKNKGSGGGLNTHYFDRSTLGYETSGVKCPVLYLINGGGDEDSAWSTIGRAGFILDNLIAAGKAKPMIVVMPNGSVTLPGITNAMTAYRSPEGNKLRVASLAKLHDAFGQDLLTGVIPYTEKNYRVLATAANRGIAGLSRGGAETLRVGLTNFDKFAYIGVFSMGAQPGMNGPFTEEVEQHNARFLSNPEETNKMVKLFWIGVGKDDRTVGLGPKNLAEGLQRHGIKYEFHESEGGHT
jgi:enterochelin esterase family protein